MLEKIKKNPRIIAFVAVISVIILTGVGIFNWVGSQIVKVPRQEAPYEREHEVEAEDKTQPEEHASGTTYKVGQQATAEVIVHEGTIEYVGEVVNTYPQTGTVLMQDGAWGGVHEFSYVEVVDIEASSRKFTYDAVEEHPSDLRIRAVLTDTGDLIALRDLSGNHPGKFANDYKIIEITQSSGKNTYHQVYDRSCDELPPYIYDFLEDNDRLDMCD